MFSAKTIAAFRKYPNLKNAFKPVLSHEMFHYFVYTHFKIKSKIHGNLTIEELGEENGTRTLGVYHFFHTRAKYPLTYSLPKMFPKFIFIELIHLVFDLIDSIRRLKPFKVLFCTRKFLSAFKLNV